MLTQDGSVVVISNCLTVDRGVWRYYPETSLREVSNINRKPLRVYLSRRSKGQSSSGSDA